MRMFIEYTNHKGKKVIRNINNIQSITANGKCTARIDVDVGTFSESEWDCTSNGINYLQFRQSLLENGLLISNDDLVKNPIGWRVFTENGKVYEVKSEEDAYNIKNRTEIEVIFEGDADTTLDNTPAIFY